MASWGFSPEKKTISNVETPGDHHPGELGSEGGKETVD